MLNIDEIMNGVVIDHITAGTGLSLYHLLELEKLNEAIVALLQNVRSQKSGKKDIIKIEEGVGIYGETPEEYLCRMETLGELMAVLDTCTEAQRRRFLLYALDGLTLAEIGTVCGCSKVAVYQSVEAVRKKFIKFFENRLNE